MAQAEPSPDAADPRTTSLPVVEDGMDAASQSLADALRISFAILKLAMVAVLVAFLFSGCFTVAQNQQALVLRFGRVTGGASGGQVRYPGAHMAFPDPVDEKVLVRTTVRSLEVTTFAPANNPPRPGPLRPGLDGYIVAADGNPVHMIWRIQYVISDKSQAGAIDKFVRQVYGAENDDPSPDTGEKPLVRAVLENTVVRTATRYTSNDILFTRTPDLRSDVTEQVRARLAPYGIDVVDVLLKGEPIPPASLIQAYTARTTAAQESDEATKKAQSDYATVLNDTAGSAHRAILDLIDQYEAARNRNDAAVAAAIEKQIFEMLEQNAEGEAALRIAQAHAEQTAVKQAVLADVQRFRELLPAFEKNPETVAANLWIETKTWLLERAAGKLYGVPRWKLVITVPSDPSWQKKREAQSYVDEVMGGQ